MDYKVKVGNLSTGVIQLGRLSFAKGMVGLADITIVEGELVRWTVTFQNTGQIPIDWRLVVWFGHFPVATPPWSGADWVNILFDPAEGRVEGTIGPGDIVTEFQVCDPLWGKSGLLGTYDVLYILNDQHDSTIMYDYVLNPGELTIVSGVPSADITSAFLEIA